MMLLFSTLFFLVINIGGSLLANAGLADEFVNYIIIPLDLLLSSLGVI